MASECSIIIPVHNSSRTLKRCIESVISQTIDNIEIIVVDDGSNIQNQMAYKEILKNDKRIRYYYLDKIGVSGARNFGIKKVKTKYMLFLDSDDYLDPNLLEKLLYDKKEGVITIAERDSEQRNNCIIKSEEYIKQLAKGKEPGYCTGMLFDRNKLLFDQDIEYMEDILYTTKQLRESKNVIFVKSSYNTTKNPDSITRTKNSDIIIKNIISANIAINKLKIICPNYSRYYNKKEVVVLESILSNLKDERQTSEILSNSEVKKILNNLQNISIIYYPQIFLARHRMIKIFWHYTIIRNGIKRIIKP